MPFWLLISGVKASPLVTSIHLSLHGHSPPECLVLSFRYAKPVPVSGSLSLPTPLLSRCWQVVLFSRIVTLETRSHCQSPPSCACSQLPLTYFTFYIVCATTSHCTMFLFIWGCMVGHPLVCWFCEVASVTSLLILCTYCCAWPHL